MILPVTIAYCFRYPQSWQELNPGFEYKLWNRKMARELFDNPKLAKWKDFYYNTLQDWIEKCDFLRFAILYIYGGTYVDLDFKCNKSLEPLLNREIGLVWEPYEHTEPADATPRRLYNGKFHFPSLKN
jgi:mannosyltransferase OCH1-like enzyme